jgi:hypothetical protein
MDPEIITFATVKCWKLMDFIRGVLLKFTLVLPLVRPSTKKPMHKSN